MTMQNEYFVAVACDVHGAEMEDGTMGDCIGVAIDESMAWWGGWDALHSVRVYRISNDEDGNATSELVHEEPVKPEVMLD